MKDKRHRLTFESEAASRLNYDNDCVNYQKFAVNGYHVLTRKVEHSVNRTQGFFPDETFFKTKKAGKPHGCN